MPPKQKKKQPVSEHKPTKVTPKTENQQNVIDSIYNNCLSIILGPAGTGKSFLSVAVAVQLLKEGAIERIVLTRPAVDVGRGLGYLPGDVNEKMGAYIVPLIDAFRYFFSYQEIVSLQNERVIEICPLSLMRGRTFNKAAILADEIQNATHEEIKLIITRIGSGSKAILNGDPTQSDLSYDERGALEYYADILRGVEGVSTVYLINEDIQRNSLVMRILDRLDHINKEIPSYGSSRFHDV